MYICWIAMFLILIASLCYGEENKYEYTKSIEGYTFEEVDAIGRDLFYDWDGRNTNKIISNKFPKSKKGFETYLKAQINMRKLWDKKIAYVWPTLSLDPIIIEFDKTFKTDVRYLFFDKDPKKVKHEMSASYIEFIYIEKYYKGILCFEGRYGKQSKSISREDLRNEYKQ